MDKLELSENVERLMRTRSLLMRVLTKEVFRSSKHRQAQIDSLAEQIEELETQIFLLAAKEAEMDLFSDPGITKIQKVLIDWIEKDEERLEIS